MRSTTDAYQEAKPFCSLPASLQTRLRGRPKATVTQKRITIRLSPDVPSTFRATGDDWQTRVDAGLRDCLKSNSAA